MNFHLFRTAVPLVAITASLLNTSGFAQEKANSNRLFDRWDQNGDGRLTPNELPAQLRNNFRLVDRDRDGFISRAEDSLFRNRNRRGKGGQAESQLHGSTLRKDIPYNTNGHQRQKLDLYYFPQSDQNPKPLPLVIWIHGGGWRAGSKDRCPATFLLEHGFAVASINYRLSQDAPFPAQIHDCKSAIIWLRQKANKYHLDPNRFGVWGSSAGGHLSTLVGTSADVGELEPKRKGPSNSRVQAVCDWFGPTDLLRMNEQAGNRGVLDHDSPTSPESQLIGGPIQENRSLADKANPIKYLSPDDPPFLIMHGDRDFLVPIQQSQILHQALKAKGMSSKLVVIPGKGHGGFDPEKVRPQIHAFFREHLASPITKTKLP